MRLSKRERRPENLSTTTKARIRDEAVVIWDEPVPAPELTDLWAAPSERVFLVKSATTGRNEARERKRLWHVWIRGTQHKKTFGCLISSVFETVGCLSAGGGFVEFYFLQMRKFAVVPADKLRSLSHWHHEKWNHILKENFSFVFFYSTEQRRANEKKNVAAKKKKKKERKKYENLYKNGSVPLEHFMKKKPTNTIPRPLWCFRLIFLLFFSYYKQKRAFLDIKTNENCEWLFNNHHHCVFSLHLKCKLWNWINW